MPPKKPSPPATEADEIERQIMADLDGSGDEPEPFADLEEGAFDDEEISVVELLEELQECLRIAYLATVDAVAPVPPPEGDAKAAVLNRCSLSVAALVAAGVSHQPTRETWFEYLVDAYRTVSNLLLHDDLEPELQGALRLLHKDLEGLAPEMRDVLSQPGLGDDPRAQIEGWDAADLADLLPDASTAAGALATKREVLAWLHGNFANYPEDKAREAAAAIAAYDVADIHAQDEEALLRMVVVKDATPTGGDVAFFCLKSNRQETDSLGEATLMNGDPRTWESPDRMKAASLVLDALSNFAFEDVSVSFRPLFASFANPFGPITVGALPSPEDRRAARAARIRTNKRRH